MSVSEKLEAAYAGPWVEVDLGVLHHNLAALKHALRATSEIVFVVKADAYGHGLLPVARAAVEAGIRWVAVAYLDEALALRSALDDVNILVLGAVDARGVADMLEHRITPVVVSEQHGLHLAVEAERLGRELPVHLKVDTGMSRLGVLWDEAGDVLNRLIATQGLDVQGLCSHFATVESDEPDAARTQFQRFAAVLESSPRKLFTHISSSRAFLYRQEWDLDAVRVGIAAYGYGTEPQVTRAQTQPILQWKTHVAQVKHIPEGSAVGYYGTYITPAATRIAVLAAGYADGYLRTLSNRGHVLIRGRRCRVIGRVSMNWITVDVGLEGEIHEGDEAVLLGCQDGRCVWADELASRSRTIAYEILTNIHPRAPRKYLHATGA